MTKVLVSGTEVLVAQVATALRSRGADVVEVPDLDDVAAACAAAGPRAFDSYVQLPATFQVRGSTAVRRVHHFYAEGVLARFTALDAALPALTEHARVVFVMGLLPPEVTSEVDKEARRTLTRVLGRAAQADAAPGELEVRLLEADAEPASIAALALGRVPAADDSPPSEQSLEDWRVELMSVVLVDT